MASEGEKERCGKSNENRRREAGGGRCLCQLSLFIRYLYHLISAPFTAPQTLQYSYVMHSGHALHVPLCKL